MSTNNKSPRSMENSSNNNSSDVHNPNEDVPKKRKDMKNGTITTNKHVKDIFKDDDDDHDDDDNHENDEEVKSQKMHTSDNLVNFRKHLSMLKKHKGGFEEEQHQQQEQPFIEKPTTMMTSNEMNLEKDKHSNGQQHYENGKTQDELLKRFMALEKKIEYMGQAKANLSSSNVSPSSSSAPAKPIPSVFARHPTTTTPTTMTYHDEHKENYARPRKYMSHENFENDEYFLNEAPKGHSSGRKRNFSEYDKDDIEERYPGKRLEKRICQNEKNRGRPYLASVDNHTGESQFIRFLDVPEPMRAKDMMLELLGMNECALKELAELKEMVSEVVTELKPAVRLLSQMTSFLQG